MDMLDKVFELLQSRGDTPVHNREVTTYLHELGLVEDADKNGQTIVYRTILNEVNRLGAASRFQRGARACWIITDNYDPTKHVVTPNKTKKSEDRRYEKKVDHVPAEGRRCGNCKFLAFYGPHFLYQTGGHCNNDEKSKRPYVKVGEDACEFWRQRSRDQIEADKREKAADLIHIQGGGSRKKKERKK